MSTMSKAGEKDSNQGPESALKEETIQEDWGLALDFHLFAQHERHKVYFFHSDLSLSSSSLLSPDYFWVECVEALTPVDMLNLSSGIHDATGNCVWTGAFLFLAAQSLLTELYFQQKTILELGAGTGIAGLALLTKQQQRQQQTGEKADSSSSSEDAADRRPKLVCLTDSDPDVLRLCRRNCEINDISESLYQIRQHFWGTTQLTTLETDDKEDECHRALGFDTVIAADILYDIGMLEAIFQSAKWALSMSSPSSSCKQTGHFILSHVPRACYSSQHPPPTGGDTLEDLIIREATQASFGLVSILRPMDVIAANGGKDATSTFPSDALNDTTLEEMAEVGAAIFIFQLQNKNDI